MLAQQFDDTKWTEQGCNSVRVKEWTPDEVSNWTKSVKGMQEDVSNLFIENSINGTELLALDRDGLKDIGVKRVGTICLLLEEIGAMKEKVNKEAATLIEHSPYCFGKILDFLRLKYLNSLELTGPAKKGSICTNSHAARGRILQKTNPTQNHHVGLLRRRGITASPSTICCRKLRIYSGNVFKYNN
eukprot:scaffold15185_cov72-Skeletonema_dohrnii-CCMP3373.AAC.2